MHKIRNFHEGHSTVGEWQGSGRVMAGERHGMCELAFSGTQYFRITVHKNKNQQILQPNAINIWMPLIQ
jgi:hypothetical protein